MPLNEPESMEGLVYFTNRILEGGKGKIKAWVYKKTCPNCGKAKMGKPTDKKGVKARAKEYKCPGCGFIEEKQQHEDSLSLEGKYTCPECGKEGESISSYKRKKFMGVPAYVIECSNCGATIPLTKKMKEVKKDKCKMPNQMPD